MMQLTKHQRAILKEMGIRVWQPEPLASAPEASISPSITHNKLAIDSIAVSARNTRATATFDAKKRTFEAVLTPPLPDNALASPATTRAAPSADTWRVGDLQTLYSDTATPEAKRWLLLIEQPESALQSDFSALAGDAGKLLDNMLRAAKLHTGAVVMLAPLVRSSSAPGSNLASQLTDVLASAKADIVISMGRLAGQAVLQSVEPFARLRGQIHSIQNIKTVVTLNPTHLLRYPLDKAKAWDDLCLAISVVASTSN